MQKLIHNIVIIFKTKKPYLGGGRAIYPFILDFHSVSGFPTMRNWHIFSNHNDVYDDDDNNHDRNKSNQDKDDHKEDNQN